MAEDPENEAKLREIPASEILKKIENGDDVKYDCVYVIGNLDLSKINTPRDKNNKMKVESEIKISESTIDGKINLEDILFNKAIEFQASKFTKNVSFNNSKFYKKASFCGAEFDGEAYFSKTNFNGSASFLDAKFGDKTNFEKAEFSEDATFRDAKFDGTTYFSKAKFNKHADFLEAVFDGYIYFDEATFSGVADFNGAEFGGQAYFRGAKFNNHADFKGAEFSKRTTFMNSEFKQRLILSSADFNRLYIRWEQINNDHLEYDVATYLSLVNSLKDIGFFEDADSCYYRYRTIRRKKHLEGIKTKLFDYIAWLAYGYGIRPRNPLILSLGLFLISIFIFVAGFGLQEPLGSIINATYLSVFVFTSSPKTDPLTGIYAFWGIIERIVGWLLMASFLVVLAKKTVR